MRKSIALMVTVLMTCVCLAGCVSEQSPSDQVGSILEQIKATGVDTLVEKLFDKKNIPEDYADEYADLTGKIKEFDYTIKDESVDEDKASVTVEITTYDFASAYKKTRKKVDKDAEEQSLNKDSDVSSYVNKQFLKNLLKLKDKTKTTEVKIECVRNEDGDWTPQVEDNQELVDAILGGLVSALK